jgi:DNA-binding MarR family transcriptional regulator
MDTALVRRVRSFNRLVTERVGALNDHFLGRDRPLGECRLLWEIGAAGDAVEIRQLRARLALDSAYVSRLLRSLESQGLVAVEEDAGDARVRRVRLTRAGRAERVTLDRLSDDCARSLLEPLGGAQRERLAAAMAEVERLLLASMVRVEPCDPDRPAARWCLDQYYQEIGRRFEGGFDVTRARPTPPAAMMPPAGLFLVAWLREEPVACGALLLHGTQACEIKRMWVAPSARGMGLGARMLRELEERGRQAGARAVRLDTNRALQEAIALYRRTGYREVPPFNDEPHAHHWFEKPL